MSALVALRGGLVGLLALCSAVAQPGRTPEAALPPSPWADDAMVVAVERELGMRRDLLPKAPQDSPQTDPATEDSRPPAAGWRSTWTLIDALIVVGSTLVLAAVVLLGVRHLWRRRGSSPPRRARQPREPGLVDAERRMAEGDFHAAIGVAYRCGVRAIHREGGVPATDGLSDGAILRHLSGSPRARHLFEELAAAFQPVRYGGQDAALVDAARTVALARALLQALVAGREPA